MEGNVSQDLDELLFVLGSTRKELLSRVLTGDTIPAKWILIRFPGFDTKAAGAETIRFDELSYTVVNRKLATLFVRIHRRPGRADTISKAYNALREAGRCYRVEGFPDKLLVDIKRPDTPPLTCALDPVETDESWIAAFGLTEHVKQELKDKAEGKDRRSVPVWPEGPEPEAIPRVCGIPIPLGIGGRRLHDYIVSSGMAPDCLGFLEAPARLNGNTKILLEALFYEFAGRETVATVRGFAVGDRRALSSLFAALRDKGKILEQAEGKKSQGFTSLVSPPISRPPGRLHVAWMFSDASREDYMFAVTLTPED